MRCGSLILSVCSAVNNLRFHICLNCCKLWNMSCLHRFWRISNFFSWARFSILSITCQGILEDLSSDCQLHFLKWQFNFWIQDMQSWGMIKVIDTKYSKHWLYTVAHIFDCVCSKINNSWFNPWFSFYFSSLFPAPYIEWYMC